MASIWRRRDAENGHWWLSYRDRSGRYVKRSLKTTDRRLAEKTRRLVAARIAFFDLMDELRADLSLPSPAVVGAKRDLAADWAARWPRLNSRERQAVVFVLFGGTCTYCGADVHIPNRRESYATPDRAVIDHRLPFSAGGSDALTNAALSCNACNMHKADRAEAEFPAVPA